MVLRLRTHAPDWNRAKCAGTVGKDDPDPFFSTDPNEALEICNGCEVCPIREECLLFALVNNCATGVYGGMEPSGRKALRKKWPLAKGIRRNKKIEYQARPEWEWYPPGEAEALVTPTQLTED